MSNQSTLVSVAVNEEEVSGVVSKGILFAKEKIQSIEKKHNKHYKKLAPVNVIRESFCSIHTLLCGENNEVKVIKDPSKLIEQYKIKHGDTEVAFTVKTYLPSSVIGIDSVQNHTIVQMNQGIEKAKKYFGEELMLLIRKVCLNLVSSATDHRLDCWVEQDEFSFRFCVPYANLNIEILILK